jgi:amino acid adenylation domain-containing protein/FkbM family methyltransferase
MQELAVEGFQLSPRQRHIWLLQEGETVLPYRAQAVVGITGKLGLSILQTAIESLVRTHEILRTTFQSFSGLTMAVQVIEENPDALVIPFHDFSALHTSEQEARIDELIDGDGAAAALEDGPVLRVQVAALAAERHVMVISLPALCADTVGLHNLFEELSRIYAVHSRGEVESSEAMQYADISEWQNELLEAPGAEVNGAYWHRQDWSALQAAKLPYEMRLPTQSFAPRSISIAMSAECVAGIDALAKEHDITPSVFLLACWQVLLCRLSAQEEVIVGVAFDGRNYEGLAPALGLFTKYLPVRSQFAESLDFDKTLGPLAQVVRESHEYQEHFNAEKLGDPDETETAVPFFHFCFDYEQRPAAHAAGNVTFWIDKLCVYADRFKFRLCCVRADDSLSAELHYDADLFSRQTVERIGAEFQTLVESAIRNPQCAIDELELLSEAERRQTLFELNESKDGHTDQCIHLLFEALAAQAPDVVAVVCENGQLSYSELNSRANQLAHYLQRAGVRPETKVGILTDRSLEMVVGLLGVLKAGGAYVPLDAAYPSERLSYMLSDADVEVLLTQEHLLNVLPRHNTGKIICLDTGWDAVASESIANPENTAAPDNLAYVIYTSGSSGAPKGVAVEHRQLSNYLHAIRKVLDLSLPFSFATVSTLAADLGNTAIYPALCSGATLHVIAADRAMDAVSLGEYFTHHQVDCLKIVPSHLTALLATPQAALVLPRRCLVLGGEASHWKLLERVRELSPGCAVINHYGPTETTVGVLTHRVMDGHGDSFSATLPLGRPLANTQVYVLDPQLRPVPAGVAGEIFIGGAGLSRGYLHAPEATAEKFIAHPYSEEPGARLYRTGDLARYLSNGEIEFLGRVDDQVKLRGYRIELGEIESVLRGHPAVDDAVVVINESESAEKHLVSYVVPGRRYRETFQGRLRYRLPNGMAVVHQNNSETDHLYREIFEEEGYLRHGIELPEAACVFDVGANIGMFTLFVGERCPQASVYAFEPIKEVYESLRLNAELYGEQRVKVFNYGLDEREKIETFTFYPRQSVMSGISELSNAAYEMEVVKTSLLHQTEYGSPVDMALMEDTDDLVRESFAEQKQQCLLRRLSDVIREQNVKRIDLLKVDVQRAEMNVLRGIEDADWARIAQVAMEVHDAKGTASEGRLIEVENLLKRNGFIVAVEQVEALRGTDRYNLFAVRSQPTADNRAQGAWSAEAPTNRVLTDTQVRSYLRDRLPEYMVPTWVVLLDELPLTPNGKVNRRALPSPEQSDPATEQSYVAPSTQTEEIVSGVWAEVLGLARVSVEANFFELGGHSLMATLVMSRLRGTFGIELHVRSLFEAPTVRGLSAIVVQEMTKGDALPAPPITRVPRDITLPLSFAQQRLWFIDQLDPLSTLYNIPAAVRLKGQLDVQVLEQTLSEIVRRHEALRTTFTARDGEPIQLIQPARHIRLDVRDLTQMSATERESAALRLAVEEGERPFDLSCEPMFRVALLRLDEAEHILLVTMHHIASDGWSMGVLVKEVATLYSAYLEDLASPLPELAIQYADFAHWQREWLQGEVLEEQLSYWRERLSGAPALLELPTDRARPAVQSFRGAHYSFSVPAELTRELQQLSRREGVTLFMTLLAAFQTLLWRYSVEQDIVVGADVANRNRQETEGLIGFFVNMLVLRTRVDGEESFAELLRQVREVCLGGYAHQDVPFEKLVEELQPERSMSHTPLFQVVFVLQNAPVGELELPGLQLSSVEVENPIAKFDLTLLMEEREGQLGATLEYNTDLFDAERIERMSRHLVALLQAVVVQPGEALARLSLLIEGEREQQLQQWNDTATAYPDQSSLAELFEAQVALGPERVAVVYGAEEISYGELNQRANQLAHRLRSLGVGPEVLVGLLLERSVEMVVGLLGILKAGGAYLPLDPTYPLERLSFMLAEAQAPVLLTQEKLLDSVPAAYWGEVLKLDTEWASVANEPVGNPSLGLGGEQLCYVAYTSGSTGQPKGVAVPQCAVVRLVFDTNYVQLGPSDRLAQVANISFDAATFEIWGALLHGAQLNIITKEMALSAPEFGAQLKAQEISVMFLTTALFNQIARLAPDAFVSLRYLLFGGEAVDPKWVREVLLKGAPQHLLHVYGPTENTTFSTWQEVRAVNDGAQTIPIGGPVSNTQMYVLDQQQQVMPIGVAGELYLGGAGLARGYLEDAALTAQRFVPHPYSNERGTRLYRTGDLVRYRFNGELEFLGRVDQQVKVRGFRIELGEIETVLDEHAGVAASVVVAREDVAGERRLVAYVVANEQQPAGVVELRAYLRERLPEYMMPQAFVMLEALPLTSNGKVDRRSLPAPEQQSRTEMEQTYVAPRTPVEEMLVEVWQEILSVAQVGIHDDFFNMGGHSLLATQLMSRVREIFGVEVPLRQLFEAPTVAELAQHIEAALKSDTQLQVPPILPVSRETPLPLSFAQQRLWFIDQLEPGSSLYNVSAAMRLCGQLNVEALQLTLDEIVRRHESLRTTFTVNDANQPVQVINPVQPLALLQLDLESLEPDEREREAARLIEAQAQQPYDLSVGPLLRAQLLRLGEEEHILAVTMHHIVTDGWSMGVLVKEVAALYAAFAEGRPSPLAELPIQYGDFAHWQREWLQGAVLEEQLRYWREQLGGAPGVLELVTDRKRAAVQSFRGASETFELGEELKSGLKELSRREGVTLFMTLLAAFKTLLYRYSGQVDIVLGTDVANRNRAETEPLFGFFVNQLVLRTNLSGNPSFRELLQRVRDVTLGAYAHQDMPFDKLVETLRPDRTISLTPLFQGKLVLQNAPMPPLELPGLTLQPVDNGNAFSTAKFDLLLTLVEMPDGLWGIMEYSTDLFEDTTIKRMLRDFEILLGDVVARPETPINILQIQTENERKQQELEKRKREQSNLRKFKGSKPKAVSFSPKNLVSFTSLSSGQIPPLVLQPVVKNVDLLSWASINQEFIETNLLRHGGILFRGFDIISQDKFEHFLKAISLRLMQYAEGATPRTQVGDRIYTSTEYPPDQIIALHNELTYVTSWPMKILFCCLQPAEERGETPIADVRRVLQRISPQVKQRFIEKGWMLVRNFGAGLSLPWQTSFHTTEKSEVETYCRHALIEWEWKTDDKLRTRQSRSAIAQHPQTGEMVWFNHVAFWHVSSLEPKVREAMSAMFKEDELPYNTYYGDGSPIEDAVVEEIREAYREETIAFGWEKGDVLLLDNMLVCHGRNSYSGPRRILAAMGDAYNGANGQETK